MLSDLDDSLEEEIAEEIEETFASNNSTGYLGRQQQVPVPGAELCVESTSLHDDLGSFDFISGSQLPENTFGCTDINEVCTDINEVCEDSKFLTSEDSRVKFDISKKCTGSAYSLNKNAGAVFGSLFVEEYECTEFGVTLKPSSSFSQEWNGKSVASKISPLSSDLGLKVKYSQERKKANENDEDECQKNVVEPSQKLWSSVATSEEDRKIRLNSLSPEPCCPDIFLHEIEKDGYLSSPSHDLFDLNTHFSSNEWFDKRSSLPAAILCPNQTAIENELSRTLSLPTFLVPSHPYKGNGNFEADHKILSSVSPVPSDGSAGSSGQSKEYGTQDRSVSEISVSVPRVSVLPFHSAQKVSKLVKQFSSQSEPEEIVKISQEVDSSQSMCEDQTHTAGYYDESALRRTSLPDKLPSSISFSNRVPFNSFQLESTNNTSVISEEIPYPKGNAVSGMIDYFNTPEKYKFSPEKDAEVVTRKPYHLTPCFKESLEKIETCLSRSPCIESTNFTGDGNILKSASKCRERKIFLTKESHIESQLSADKEKILKSCENIEIKDFAKQGNRSPHEDQKENSLCYKARPSHRIHDRNCEKEGYVFGKTKGSCDLGATKSMKTKLLEERYSENNCILTNSSNGDSDEISLPPAECDMLEEVEKNKENHSSEIQRNGKERKNTNVTFSKASCKKENNVKGSSCDQNEVFDDQVSEVVSHYGTNDYERCINDLSNQNMKVESERNTKIEQHYVDYGIPIPKGETDGVKVEEDAKFSSSNLEFSPKVDVNFTEENIKISTSNLQPLKEGNTFTIQPLEECGNSMQELSSSIPENMHISEEEDCYDVESMLDQELVDDDDEKLSERSEIVVGLISNSPISAITERTEESTHENRVYDGENIDQDLDDGDGSINLCQNNVGIETRSVIKGSYESLPMHIASEESSHSPLPGVSLEVPNGTTSSSCIPKLKPKIPTGRIFPVPVRAPLDRHSSRSLHNLAHQPTVASCGLRDHSLSASSDDLQNRSMKPGLLGRHIRTRDRTSTSPDSMCEGTLRRRCVSAVALNENTTRHGRAKCQRSSSLGRLNRSRSSSLTSVSSNRPHDYSHVRSKVAQYIKDMKERDLRNTTRQLLPTSPPTNNSKETSPNIFVLDDAFLNELSRYALEDSCDEIKELRRKIEDKADPQLLEEILNLLVLERKFRHASDTTLAALQLQYDNMTAMFAEKQNEIDRLRFYKDIKVSQEFTVNFRTRDDKKDGSQFCSPKGTPDCISRATNSTHFSLPPSCSNSRSPSPSILVRATSTPIADPNITLGFNNSSLMSPLCEALNSNSNLHQNFEGILDEELKKDSKNEENGNQLPDIECQIYERLKKEHDRKIQTLPKGNIPVKLEADLERTVDSGMVESSQEGFTQEAWMNDTTTLLKRVKDYGVLEESEALDHDERIIIWHSILQQYWALSSQFPSISSVSMSHQPGQLLQDVGQAIQVLATQHKLGLNPSDQCKFDQSNTSIRHSIREGCHSSGNELNSCPDRERKKRLKKTENTNDTQMGVTENENPREINFSDEVALGVKQANKSLHTQEFMHLKDNESENSTISRCEQSVSKSGSLIPEKSPITAYQRDGEREQRLQATGTSNETSFSPAHSRESMKTVGLLEKVKLWQETLVDPDIPLQASFDSSTTSSPRFSFNSSQPFDPPHISQLSNCQEIGYSEQEVFQKSLLDRGQVDSTGIRLKQINSLPAKFPVPVQSPQGTSPVAHSFSPLRLESDIPKSSFRSSNITPRQPCGRGVHVRDVDSGCPGSELSTRVSHSASLDQSEGVQGDWNTIEQKKQCGKLDRDQLNEGQVMKRSAQEAMNPQNPSNISGSHSNERIGKECKVCGSIHNIHANCIFPKSDSLGSSNNEASPSSDLVTIAFPKTRDHKNHPENDLSDGKTAQSLFSEGNRVNGNLAQQEINEEEQLSSISPCYPQRYDVEASSDNGGTNVDGDGFGISLCRDPQKKPLQKKAQRNKRPISDKRKAGTLPDGGQSKLLNNPSSSYHNNERQHRKDSCRDSSSNLSSSKSTSFEIYNSISRLKKDLNFIKSQMLGEVTHDRKLRCKKKNERKASNSASKLTGCQGPMKALDSSLISDGFDYDSCSSLSDPVNMYHGVNTRKSPNIARPQSSVTYDSRTSRKPKGSKSPQSDSYGIGHQRSDSSFGSMFTENKVDNILTSTPRKRKSKSREPSKERYEISLSPLQKRFDKYEEGDEMESENEERRKKIERDMRKSSKMERKERHKRYEGKTKEIVQTNSDMEENQSRQDKEKMKKYKTDQRKEKPTKESKNRRDRQSYSSKSEDMRQYFTRQREGEREYASESEIDRSVRNRTSKKQGFITDSEYYDKDIPVLSCKQCLANISGKLTKQAWTQTEKQNHRAQVSRSTCIHVSTPGHEEKTGGCDINTPSIQAGLLQDSGLLTSSPHMIYIQNYNCASRSSGVDRDSNQTCSSPQHRERSRIHLHRRRASSHEILQSSISEATELAETLRLRSHHLLTNLSFHLSTPNPAASVQSPLVAVHHPQATESSTNEPLAPNLALHTSTQNLLPSPHYLHSSSVNLHTSSHNPQLPSHNSHLIMPGQHSSSLCRHPSSQIQHSFCVYSQPSSPVPSSPIVVSQVASPAPNPPVSVPRTPIVTTDDSLPISTAGML